MKRAFDFAAAAIGLLVALPLIVLCVLLIRRDSQGTALFSQERVGWRGRMFRCHKLRTMSLAAPNVPTHMALPMQVTRVGGFLRRTKLDELPQLWNVLKGEMSLVGPRPCLPSQTDLIEERQRRGVLELRPGITGLAQIRGIDMSVPVQLAEVDAEYLRRRNFVYDVKILLQTVSSTTGFGDRINK